MPARNKTANPISVEPLKHDEAKRKNLPAAEHQSVVREDEVINHLGDEVMKGFKV